MNRDTNSRLFPPWLILLGFLALVVGVGAALGIATAPGEWYWRLNKPWFNPPDWVFSPVWLVLYILLAIAGYRTWRNRPHGLALKIWWVQIFVNWSWPVLFFEFRLLWTAVALTLAMIALTIGFLAAAWREGERLSIWLLVPYLVWIGYATILSGAIVAFNWI